MIVGRGIDPTAGDLKPISTGQLAFRYGPDIVASTLSSAQERDVARQLQGTNSEEQIQINGEPFLANLFLCF